MTLFVFVVLLFACCKEVEQKRNVIRQVGIGKGELSKQEARAIAREVFLWGMHPVAIYHLRYNQVQNEKSVRYAGINRIKWVRNPIKALPRTVVTPRASTLYGTAMLDLTHEPVVVTAPTIRNHYWSVQFADNYGRWFPVAMGNQCNAQTPVRQLLVGPDWHGKLPPGFSADILRLSSNFAVVVALVALTSNSPAELRFVNAMQDDITLMSLSTWLNGGDRLECAEDVPCIKGNYPTYPRMDTVWDTRMLKGVDFLRWVNLVLNDSSFTKQKNNRKEGVAFARFARLGLKTGQSFDPSKFSPEIIGAIAAGVEDGRKEALASMAKRAVAERNGWRYLIDPGYSDSNWVDRARYGMVALLGPVPCQSQTAARCQRDLRGQWLSGANKYTITFSLSDLPPVTQFWEMPLYDKDGFFYNNYIDRYAISSYMLWRNKLHTENGKLVIYVQHDEPKDPKQRQNWLPAPEGKFQLAARFYGPDTPLINGSYNMPGLVRAE